jgi:hypothetical protein
MWRHNVIPSIWGFRKKFAGLSPITRPSLIWYLFSSLPAPVSPSSYHFLHLPFFHLLTLSSLLSDFPRLGWARKLWPWAWRGGGSRGGAKAQQARGGGMDVGAEAGGARGRRVEAGGLHVMRRSCPGEIENQFLLHMFVVLFL